MTRWNRLTRPLALLVIGSLATSAIAQPAPPPKKQPTQQELDRARVHFKAAEAAKARRDYKTAAAEYLAAYELFADPEFFYNVGEVYRLAGDEPRALTYYQKYLELEPHGRGAAAARTAVGELRRSIAAKQDAARRAAEDEARRKPDENATKRAAGEEARRKADDVAERKAAEDARREADENTAELAAEDEARRTQPTIPPEVPPAAPAPATRVWYRDPIALGLLGAGVAATGVGTGFLISARSEHVAALRSPNLDTLRMHSDKARSRRNLGLITGGLGVALVAGGVTWIVLHRDAREQRTITGWLAPGGGGLAITGPF